MTPEELRDAWSARWPEALAAWSRLLRLTPPHWCVTEQDEAREGLSDTFAQIRLDDHVVVLSARRILGEGLQDFPLEIMGHEIGHHVYAPGDLVDDGRTLARMRRALPGKQHLAPMVANLYQDLLINDRLQRSASLRMADVWRVLAERGAGDGLWTLYMTMYEHLWSLRRGELSRALADARTELDARLGARLIRAYAKDWVRGAGKFAALLLPYLQGDAQGCLAANMDMLGQVSSSVPAGLTNVDEDEGDFAHPMYDAELAGVAQERGLGGRKTLAPYREIHEYGELLKALGSTADEATRAARYYRERALPHLVRYPTRAARHATEPLPEGLDTWDVGSPLERIDWLQSIVRSPHVVPGVTTVERTYGDSPGREPRRAPVDLYVGIDCSGSMPNPRQRTSYPALAGTIVSLSALRAGARVKVVLSGEPGRTYAMPRFGRDEREILDVLTSYLGTGTGFGVGRLAETFDGRTERDPPVHVLLLSDGDLFQLLASGKGRNEGWEVARRGLRAARGGGTVVLNMPPKFMKDEVARLRADGWRVHFVSAWEELVAFARDFSRDAYAEVRR